MSRKLVLVKKRLLQGALVVSLSFCLQGCTFFSVVSFIADVLSIYSFVDSGFSDDNQKLSAQLTSKPAYSTFLKSTPEVVQTYFVKTSERAQIQYDLPPRGTWEFRVIPSPRMAPTISLNSEQVLPLSEPTWDIYGNILIRFENFDATTVHIEVSDHFENGGGFTYELVQTL